jgi:hypothetical protein
MSAVTRVDIRFEAKKLVDSVTRAAAIGLHTVWTQTLGAVTAMDAMSELESYLRLLERRTVVKALAWEGDDLVGVGFLTNELELVPGISVEFFRARFTVEMERGSVWYAIGGVAHPARAAAMEGIRRICVEQARSRRADVLLWDSSSLRQEASQRTTIDAVADVYGWVPPATELDRVSYMAMRLPQPEGEVIDLRP